MPLANISQYLAYLFDKYGCVCVLKSVSKFKMAVVDRAMKNISSPKTFHSANLITGNHIKKIAPYCSIFYIFILLQYILVTPA